MPFRLDRNIFFIQISAFRTEKNWTNHTANICIYFQPTNKTDCTAIAENTVERKKNLNHELTEAEIFLRLNKLTVNFS